MGILDDLLGGGQRQRDFKDCVNRYEQGHPAEGYSDQEVADRYRDVAHAVPPDQYAQAAQEALARLSPEERAEFVKMLQERAQSRGVALPKQVGSDPRDLGQVVTDLHQVPGRLRDLLGGGGRPGRRAGSSPLAGMLASPGEGGAREYRSHGREACDAGFGPLLATHRHAASFPRRRSPRPPGPPNEDLCGVWGERRPPAASTAARAR